MKVKYVGESPGIDTRLKSLGGWLPGEEKEVSEEDGKVLLMNPQFVNCGVSEEVVRPKKKKLEVLEDG